MQNEAEAEGQTGKGALRKVWWQALRQSENAQELRKVWLSPTGELRSIAGMRLHTAIIWLWLHGYLQASKGSAVRGQGRAASLPEWCYGTWA